MTKKSSQQSSTPRAGNGGRVSLKEVARLAGVAPSTVSFILNGKAQEMRIREEVANKVKEVARKAGYTPHQVAVSLRTGQSRILGLVVESISGSFFAALARVIEEEASRYGYRVVYTSTENDAAKGRAMIHMLSHWHVDGYLITPAPGMEKDIQELLDKKRPVVLMDGFFPGIKAPFVLVDNYAGVKTGVQQFIKKGYQRIGFVTADVDLVQLDERLNGYRETLEANNIPVQKKRILKIPYNHPRPAAIKMIADFLQNTSPRLDAVYFSTNYLGLLGLEALRQLNWQVPKDIAMMSFDDHDIFRLLEPGITVMEQPVEEIAKTAIQLLMKQLGKADVRIRKTQVRLPGKFIQRGSL